MGNISNGGFTCPYHGWSFAADGQCTGIPSLGGACRQADITSVPAYATCERYGLVWVALDTPTISDLPTIPEFENNWSYHVAEPWTSAAAFVERSKTIDMAHFAFAHRSTLGKAAQSVVDTYSIHRETDGFRMEAEFPSLAVDGHESVGNSSAGTTAPRSATCQISQRFAKHGMMAISVYWYIPSPITETSCRVFWAVAISPNFDGPTPDEQLGFAVTVLDEDRIMCENQRPLEVPLDERGAAVVPADRLAMTYQHRFREWLIATAASAAVAT